jgi:hypothetical protein
MSPKLYRAISHRLVDLVKMLGIMQMKDFSGI